MREKFCHPRAAKGMPRALVHRQVRKHSCSLLGDAIIVAANLTIEEHGECSRPAARDNCRTQLRL